LIQIRLLQLKLKKAERIKQAKLMNNLLNCYRRRKDNLLKKNSVNIFALFLKLLISYFILKIKDGDQETNLNSKQSNIFSDYNLYTNNKVTKIVEEDEMIDFSSDKKILNNKLSFIDSRNSIF
jgi:hypothetical protein